MFSMRMRQSGKSPFDIATEMARNLDRVTEENREDLVTTAQQKVHVITGRTMRSIRVQMLSPTRGQLHADYGGPWEQRRGEPHNFADQALAEVKKRFIQRTHAAVEDAKR